MELMVLGSLLCPCVMSNSPPHQIALGADEGRLELSLEHPHNHGLVPLEILVPGFLRNVLGEHRHYSPEVNHTHNTH